MNRFLRSLTPDQQVSLLFVTVFGLLALASGVLFLLSLRERNRSDGWWQQLRHAGGVMRRSWIMMGLFWVAWVSGPVAANVLFAIASLLTLREFISLSPTHRSDHKTLVLLFFVVIPVQYMLVTTQQFNLVTVFIPVYVFLVIPFVSSLGNDPHRFLERNSKLQWGTMVCVFGLSHVPALLLLEFDGFAGRSAFLVFFLVTVVQSCMLVQHLASRWLQQPPTLPQISQSFNWRSWGAGVAGGAVVGALLSGITPFNPGRGFVVALVACIAGSMGHLVMKAIKRDRGVHNWGSMGQGVTGASGLLDRVDALAFAAPVFFHFLRWKFGV